jgi:D-amino peptidase
LLGRAQVGKDRSSIDGAAEAGADYFLVNDSHGAMQNLAPDELHGGAEYLSGRHKPLYMMEGLDPSFDAIFFIGYHGAIDGPPAILSHTYSPVAVMGASLNGTLAGESGINCLAAAHYGVPVALVTGDQHTAAQARPFCPEAEMVVVKHSLTRFAARSLHPEAARQAIRLGARAALERLGGLAAPQFPAGCGLRLRLRDADLVTMATAIRDVTRESDTQVLVGGDDPLMVFRNFVALLQIIRGLARER